MTLPRVTVREGKTEGDKTDNFTEIKRTARTLSKSTKSLKGNDGYNFKQAGGADDRHVGAKTEDETGIFANSKTTATPSKDNCVQLNVCHNLQAIFLLNLVLYHSRNMSAFVGFSSHSLLFSFLTNFSAFFLFSNNETTMEVTSLNVMMISNQSIIFSVSS